MRFYGLDDYFQTLSRSLRIDVETLRFRVVDISAAILALHDAGRLPVSQGERQDTADGLHRLMVDLTLLMPYRAGLHETTVAAAATDYARNRGYELRLPDRGRGLTQIIQTESLPPRDIKRALYDALHAVPGSARTFPENFQGISVCISHAVSDPSPELVGVTAYLSREIGHHLRSLGAQVRAPVTHELVAGDGRTHRGKVVGERPRRTGETFTRSIDRLSNSHVLIVISEPRSQGSCVEREWAMRLRIPVVELRLDRCVHPHQDGPGRVRTFDVDVRRPRVALDAIWAHLDYMRPVLRDQVAVHRAYEMKNEAPLTYLRTAWKALHTQERANVTRITELSPAYVEALLSNGVALELASLTQRQQLETVMGVPTSLSLAGWIPRLSERDRATVAEAGVGLGLTGVELVAAVSLAEDQLARSKMRANHITRAQAQAQMVEALAAFRGQWR